MATAVETPQSTSSRANKRPSIKRLVIALACLFGLIAGIALWLWWLHVSVRETTDDAYVTAHVHTISSQISGPVQRVMVEENYSVEKGRLLVLIDPRDYLAEVHRARAAVDEARKQAAATRSTVSQADLTARAQRSQAGGDIYNSQAEVQSARAALAAAEADVPRAKAKLLESQARLSEARVDESRYDILAKEGAVSRQQHEQFFTALQGAQADYVAASQAVRQADDKVSQSRWGVQEAVGHVIRSKGGMQVATAAGEQAKVNARNALVAESAIAKAQADLETAELKLSYTRITAPVAGRIGKRNVETGQQVSAGQQLLNVVSEPPWIDANFKETQVGRIRVGNPVEIKIDAFGDQPFIGRVDSLSPATGARFALLPPENATGNFTKVVQRVPVRIVFDRHSIAKFKDRIVPGMSAEVTVIVR